MDRFAGVKGSDDVGLLDGHEIRGVSRDFGVRTQEAGLELTSPVSASDDDAFVKGLEFHGNSFCGRRIGQPHDIYSAAGTRMIGVPKIIYANSAVGVN